MNIINHHVLNKILISLHGTKASTFHISEWHINENFVSAGNNYCAPVYQLIIRYQTVRDQENDTATKENTFFLKVPTNGNPLLYNKLAEWSFYDKEVVMYTEVLPQMYAIEGDNEYFTPPIYYFDDKMSLVLKDLSQSGYKCADRIKQLDFEHCFYALRCLAKFHALSVKLEKVGGLPESVKCSTCINIETFETKPRPNDAGTSLTSLIPTFIDNLPQKLKDRYPNMVTYIRNLSSPQTLNKMADNLTAIKLNVLNHGDFRNNNIMFKYNKYEMIEKVKLIDFQLSTWASPVRDLIYFTITSMKFEVYQKYFPLLMKVYLETLNKALHRLDCPTYDMSSLFHDMDIMYNFALFTLCCMMPIVMSDPDDPVDSKELYRDDDGNINASVAKTFKQRPFRNIVDKWFEHFAQKGTLRIDEENISVLENNNH